MTNICIESLMQNNSGPDQVIVVNNSSHTFESPYSSVKILSPADNIGYAAAINFALGFITTLNADPEDLVAFMNNDVTVKRETFRQLRNWWTKNPKPALLGVSLTERNKTTSNIGTVNLFTGRTKLSARHKLSLIVSISKIFQIEYLHGAFISAPLSVLMATKGVPDKYFMYWEDVLLSQYAKKVHIPLRVAKNIFVKHSEINNKNETALHTYYLVRNGAFFLERETMFPWPFYWWLLNRLRYLYHAFRGHTVVKQALKDSIKKNMGVKLDLQQDE